MEGRLINVVTREEPRSAERRRSRKDSAFLYPHISTMAGCIPANLTPDSAPGPRHQGIVTWRWIRSIMSCELIKVMIHGFIMACMLLTDG